MNSKQILILIFSFMTFVCFFDCQSKADKVEWDYSKSSGVNSLNLNSDKIEDLALLGKIWGFLKYYHPVVASGKYNWDFELFKIISNNLKLSEIISNNFKLFEINSNNLK